MKRFFGSSKREKAVAPVIVPPPITKETLPVQRNGSLFVARHSRTDLPTSSQSGSGSSEASVLTPNDEPSTGDSSKSWQSWIGLSKTKKAIMKSSVMATTGASSFTRDSRTILDNDDTSSESESDTTSWEFTKSAPGRHPNSIHTRASPFGISHTPPISRDASRALANLHAITIDSLVPLTSVPPLVSLPISSALPFPRSSNRIHPESFLRPTHSPLHCEILRKRLLRRIERRVLTSSEQASITPLANHTARPQRNGAKRKLPAAEESYEESKAVGGGWSKGMKKWATRACFEERVVIWKADETRRGVVVVSSVGRTGLFGVAALEFSEGAEALAGLHRQNELPPPPSDIYVPASNRRLPPPLVIPRNGGGTQTSHPNTSAFTRGGRLAPPRLQQSTAVDTSFVHAQDEDDLPLGVVMVQRRQREQAEERRRRIVEERERKAREEETQKRRYTEQVSAARERRELERIGKAAPGSAKDRWSEGRGDALPPPPRRQVSSSSGDPIRSSSASSRSSFVESSRRQTLQAPMPVPWLAEMPGSPMTAPATSLSYGMMNLPTVPDPLSLAMFEQGLMRPWVGYGVAGYGSMGDLTPPRFPSSHGGSTGSLTPPRFPNSRPSSWSSSNEDVMHRRPTSGMYYSSGDERVKSKDSMHVEKRRPGSMRSASATVQSSKSRVNTSGSEASPWTTSSRPTSSHTLPRSFRSETSMAPDRPSTGQSHLKQSPSPPSRPYAPTSSSHLRTSYMEPSSSIPTSKSTDAVNRTSKMWGSLRPLAVHSHSGPAASSSTVKRSKSRGLFS